jgi:hypothetical protein
MNEIFFKQYYEAVGSTQKKIDMVEKKKDNENPA